MRLLFLSATTVGGSGRSQRELAARLRASGHDVLVVVDPERGAALRRWLYEQLSDLAARWGDRPGGRVLRWLESRPGRRVVRAELDGVPHVLSPVPENALPRVMAGAEPDVVIGSSVLTLTWRKVGELCRATGTPTVLYIREEEAMGHFDRRREPADAVVANAESLARRVRALGVPCEVFPSVIETDVTSVSSTREVALVVNPIESRGVETIWRIAPRLPQVPFVLQESWPLTAEQLDSLQRRLCEHPNVTLRRAEPPGPRLYSDARVLLVPYRVDNRPRVVAEAQANGIPVVAGAAPAVVEAVGPGGVIVDSDEADEWVEAIASLWDDNARYNALSTAARRHSEREGIAAEAIARRFESFLREVSAHRSPRRAGAGA